jgi:hypothetical protein
VVDVEEVVLDDVVVCTSEVVVVIDVEAGGTDAVEVDDPRSVQDTAMTTAATAIKRAPLANLTTPLSAQNTPFGKGPSAPLQRSVAPGVVVTGGIRR